MHKPKPPQFPRHKFTDNNIHINMKQLSRLNNEQKSLDQNTLVLNYTQVYQSRLGNTFMNWRNKTVIV
jgi:hypothetical protein